MGDSISRITEIDVIPLALTLEGAELDTATNAYTLVQVHTDAGLTGIGSFYTSADLVKAALGRLEHLVNGEIAMEGHTYTGARVGQVLRRHS